MQLRQTSEHKNEMDEMENSGKVPAETKSSDIFEGLQTIPGSIPGLESSPTIEESNGADEGLEEKEKPKKETFTVFTANEVIELIKGETALAKVIESKVGDDSHWHFLLQQLMYPHLYRPVIALEDKDNKEIKRESCYDPSLKKWLKREIVGERGRHKNTEYTKKTSTTLLPADGRIHLFNATGVNVGIVMDLNRCQLPMSTSGHPKYAFKTNGGTNSRWWIEGRAGTIVSANTLDEIKENNRQLRKTGAETKHNEIMAKLHRQALRAMVIPKNLITDRLNCLHKKFMVQNWMKLDLPILIITKDNDVVEYKKEEWVKDIIEGLQSAKHLPAYKFCVSIIQSISLYEPKVWKEIYAQTNKLSMAAANPILWFRTLEDQELLAVTKSLLNLNEYNIPKDALLNWLCIKNAELAMWYTETVLDIAKVNTKTVESKDNKEYLQNKINQNSSLLLSAVKNHHFEAVNCLIKCGNNRSYSEVLRTQAYLLLNLYGQKEVATELFKKFHMSLNVHLTETTFAKKSLFSLLTENDIKSLTDARELDFAIYYFSEDQNIDFINKVLAMRNDVPKNNVTSVSTKYNSPQQLLINLYQHLQKICKDKSAPECKILLENENDNSFNVINTILNLCERLPEFIAHENNENETLLSLACKYDFPASLFSPLLDLVIRKNLIAKLKVTNLQRTLYYLVQHKHYDLANQLLDLKLDNAVPLFLDQSSEKPTNAMYLLINEEKPPLELIKKFAMFKDAMNTIGGVSLLVLAAQNNHLSIFSYFIKQKELNLFTIDELHKCLLQLIIAKVDTFAYLLLENFPDLNTNLAVDVDTGNTALHVALQSDFKYVFEIITWLCRFKNTALENKQQQLPLKVAALEKDNIFQCMLDQKEMVDAHTPAQLEDIVLALIQKKKFNNALKLLNRTDRMHDALVVAEESNSALHLAIMEGKPNLDLIRKLYLNKKSLCHENKHNETPLLIAAKQNKSDILNLLIVPEVIKLYSIQQLHQCLLQLIISKSEASALALLQIFPDFNSNLSIDAETGNTALHFAVQNEVKHLEIIDRLCEFKNITHENKAISNPLMLAGLEKENIFKRLLENSKFIDSHTSAQLGKIILRLVQAKNYPNAMRLLNRTNRSKESLITEVNNSNTALHLAIKEEKPNLTLIKKLYSNTLALCHENKEKETPLFIAARDNKIDILKLMFDAAIINLYNDKQLAKVLLPLAQHKQIELVSQIIEARPRAAILSCHYYWNEENGYNLLHELVRDNAIPIKLLEPMLVPDLINKETKNGATPLSIAADVNNVILIEHALRNDLFEHYSIQHITNIAYILLSHFNFDLAKQILTLNNYNFENYNGELMASLVARILETAPVVSDPIIKNTKSDYFIDQKLSESKSNDIKFDLSLFKIICSCKNICLSKIAESKTEALTLSIKRGAYSIANYIIDNYLEQFSIEQITKICADITSYQLRAPHHILEKLLNLKSKTLDITTIQKCASYLAEKFSREEKCDSSKSKQSDFCCIKLDFLENIPGKDSSEVKKNAMRTIDLLLLHTHTAAHVIQLMKDINILKPKLKYLYSDIFGIFKKDPVMEILDKCKERVIQLMKLKPELVYDKFAVDFIFIKVGDYSSYTKKFQDVLGDLNKASLRV